MSLKVDPEHLGTEESLWRSAFSSASVPEWTWGSPSRVVVLSPHPDDEVLALGGSLMRLARRHCKIDLIAVTRGEASHPKSKHTHEKIAALRQREREKAFYTLGLGAAQVVELDLPDGRVSSQPALAARLIPLIDGATLCLAPWTRDGHPDHDATGSAAALACKTAGVPLLEYVVWGWHWANPETAEFPWDRVRKISLQSDERVAKIRAIDAYRSQIMPLDQNEPDVVLPSPVLARFQRSFEVVLQ